MRIIFLPLTSYSKTRIDGIETYPYRRLASGPDLFRLRPGGGARGFPRFSDESIGGAGSGCLAAPGRDSHFTPLFARFLWIYPFGL